MFSLLILTETFYEAKGMKDVWKKIKNSVKTVHLVVFILKSY